MKLLTAEIRQKMLANGRREAADENADLKPAVKLFNPTGAQTWLLTSLDPDDADIAFGLCDLGFGCPELGSVRISELEEIRGHMGLGIERDIHWSATHALSAYATVSSQAGRIVDRLPMPAAEEIDAGPLPRI